MLTVIIAGKPVWIEEHQLGPLEDQLRLSFERVDGKEPPDFQGLQVTTHVGPFPPLGVQLYMHTKHLRHVAQWLSRLNGYVSIGSDERTLLAYENGGVSGPYNTPYPQDIDNYKREEQ